MGKDVKSIFGDGVYDCPGPGLVRGGDEKEDDCG